MVIVTLVLYSFGNYSLRSPERFTIIRSWQGKGTLACIGVLLVIAALMNLYNNTNTRYSVTILVMSAVSCCLMTSMGIILSIIMIGIYGIVIAILKRSLKLCIMSWVACIPVVILYALSEIYTLEMFLS